VNALLIGLKSIILTALKPSLAHALNRETLPLKDEQYVAMVRETYLNTLNFCGHLSDKGLLWEMIMIKMEIRSSQTVKRPSFGNQTSTRTIGLHYLQ